MSKEWHTWKRLFFLYEWIRAPWMVSPLSDPWAILQSTCDSINHAAEMLTTSTYKATHDTRISLNHIQSTLDTSDSLYLGSQSNFLIRRIEAFLRSLLNHPWQGHILPWIEGIPLKPRIEAACHSKSHVSRVDLYMMQNKLSILIFFMIRLW